MTQLASSVYPERLEPKEHALDALTRTLLGRAWHRLRPQQDRLRRLAIAAERQATEVARLEDRQLASALPNAPLARALAVVREAAARSIGLRPFASQLAGAAGLVEGKLVEMDTGEGKSLTAALAACIGAAGGMPVHVVTVNDYLAQRDAKEMEPLFGYFGLRVGAVITGMSPEERRKAYGCSITYCTNKELVFDYLKDRVAAQGSRSRAQLQLRALHRGDRHAEPLLLRGLHFAIVDEADSVFIDEARTPLILSRKSQSEDDGALFRQALELARQLLRATHYEIDLARREVHLSASGRSFLGGACAGWPGPWRVARGREMLITQALRALHLYQRDQHYLVREGKVEIVDEYTGRVLPGRTWEQSLHQLIEAKEGCPLSERNVTLARITYQRFFARYLRLAGMTGTAREVSSEVWRVYRLEMVRIAPHKPSRRLALPPLCAACESEKWLAVAVEAARVRATGRAALIGTRSVEASERLSAVLEAHGVPHRVLNARHDAEEALIIAAAGQPGAVTLATNMAGRGTDIRLSDAVRSAGGLHVILTEYHDSARIDRQLSGRGARQGDPGSVAAIVAYDDALFRHHAARLTRLLPVSHPGALGRFCLWLVRRHAQRSAGVIHAAARKETLKHDRRLDQLLGFAGNSM
jgi:preprotein translocase subunit SecA